MPTLQALDDHTHMPTLRLFSKCVGRVDGHRPSVG